MLVLTRRIGEQIVIAGDIHVAVLTVTGQKVRLGITAPAAVTVMRQELLGATSEPRRRAATRESADET